MSINIKVAATGIIALCLAFSALLYVSSITSPALEGAANKFFGLAVIIIIVVVILSLLGTQIKKFP